MVAEESTIESMKGGIVEGAGVGFAWGAARTFFYSSEIAAQAEKAAAEVKAANPGISRAALKATAPSVCSFSFFLFPYLFLFLFNRE